MLNLNPRKWFKKHEAEALVKTIKVTGNGYVYYIHLFESSTNRRRAEYTCDGFPYDIDKPGGWPRRTTEYQEKVYRWLCGRYDPDIPRYDQISEEDTAAALRGTV